MAGCRGGHSDVGFQLHRLSGVKEVFFFQFPKDPPLGLELSFRWAGDDDHPFTDVWAFCWGDLNGGPGKSGQLFNVCPFLPDDGPHGLGWDEEIHDLLLWIGVMMRERAKLVRGVQAGEISGVGINSQHIIFKGLTQLLHNLYLGIGTGLNCALHSDGSFRVVYAQILQG